MDKRIKRTKKAIKKGVYQYCLIEGNYDLSISQLCEKIKINRTTFYLHYKSIKDVIFEMQDELIQSIKYITDTDASIDEKVIFISNFLKDTDRNIIKLFDNIDSRVFLKIREFVEPEIRKSNVIYSEDEIAFQYIVDFIITGSISVYRKWIINNCEGNITTLFLNLKKMFNN